MFVKRNTFLLIILILIYFCSVLISLGMGYIEIAPSDIFKLMLGRCLPGDFSVAGNVGLLKAVVFEVRFPRLLTASAVGGGLAVAGVVFQGILLNPLADPYTLGVSSGAAFGAAIGILLNLSGYFLSIPAIAFAGGITTLLIVLLLSSSGNSVFDSFSSGNLILSGVIVAAILSAGISFLKYIAGEQVSVIIFWLMGSFASSSWFNVSVTWGISVSGFLVFICYARDLNILSAGTRTAASLGVDTVKTKIVLLLTASLIASVTVSVSGIIGFVGLLVPHLVRFLTGPDNRMLLPASFVSGAILLLVADTITRAVLPSEVPIGVLTALIGGPVFCYVFKRSHNNSWSR